MMPPPVRWLFAVAAVVLAVGVASLALFIKDYIENPRALDSDSGLVVFKLESYVSYPPFEPGIEPTVIGLGIALVAASVFVAAAVWRPRG
jgi:hypothetical protein